MHEAAQPDAISGSSGVRKRKELLAAAKFPAVNERSTAPKKNAAQNGANEERPAQCGV